MLMGSGMALQAGQWIAHKQCCPTCGQTLPDDMPPGLKLSGYRRVLFELVRKAGQHGVTTDVLFDRLYGSRADGGPESGIKVISVHACHINNRIRKFGLQIKSDGAGHGVYGTYRLVKL